MLNSCRINKSSAGTKGKVEFVVKQRLNSVNSILLLPFFLLFIGDFQLPVGESMATIPMGMAIIFPAVFWYLITGRLALSASSLLLAGVLLCGVLGFLLTPLATFLRSIAGALPIIFAVLTIIAYERYAVPHEKTITYMLTGGMVLAISVITLFIFSLSVSGDYYDQKLIIETPLGRSNYLAAFLIFLLALSMPRNVFISLIFVIAIFCTLSRGGVLALAIFFSLVLFRRRQRLLLFGVGAVSISLLLAYLLSDKSVSDVTKIVDLQDGALESMFNRFELWLFGLDILYQYPIFGVGPNTFRTFVEIAGDVENVWGVHNSLLLIILNYGSFGLIFYLTYLFGIYRYICLAEKNDTRFFYLKTAFLVLLIFGLYEPLVGSAAFETLLALLLVLARSRAGTTSRQLK